MLSIIGYILYVLFSILISCAALFTMFIGIDSIVYGGVAI